MTDTVQDLIDTLSILPPDLPLISAGDDEGNSYRFLSVCGVNIAGYDGECDNEIEISIPELTQTLKEQGFTEEDVKPNKCVLFR